MWKNKKTSSLYDNTYDNTMNGKSQLYKGSVMYI